MSLPEVEYKGLMAQSWDLLRGDTSRWPDRFMFLDLIAAHGQPVLDVGCGTGRLLLDYLQQGIDIDGVDNSPEMLALCQAKVPSLDLTPRLHHQYIETLDLPRTYRTILCPSSVLQLITDADQAARALLMLVAHLAPGGVVAAPFMTLWRPGLPLELSGSEEKVRPDGSVLRRTSRSLFDPATDLEETEDLYQVLVDGQVVAEEQHRRAPATRSYTQEQAVAAFTRAGLIDIQVYHEFTFDPAAPDDRLFTLVGRRA
jgi:SAM-dependent methyltransferase